MIYTENEIPKYKKKSNKTTKKSNHRHDYIDCLLLDKSSNHYHASQYCSICGKIGETKFLESEETPEGYHHILSDSEIVEKYKDYEIKEVEEIFKDRYVAL